MFPYNIQDLTFSDPLFNRIYDWFSDSQEMSTIAPLTMSSAELIIPKRSLEYGTYKLVFSSRQGELEGGRNKIQQKI